MGNRDGSDGTRQITVRNSDNARDQAHMASDSSKSDKGEQSGSGKAEGGAQNVTAESPSPDTLGDEFDLSSISEGDAFKQPASFEENMNVQDEIDQMQEQNIINYFKTMMLTCKAMDDTNKSKKIFIMSITQLINNLFTPDQAAKVLKSMHN